MDVFLTETSKINPDSVQRFTLTAPAKNSDWKKITAVRLKNGDMQVEKLTDKQAFHEKINAGDKLFDHEIFSLFGRGFAQLEIITSDFSYRFRAAKKRTLFQKSRSNCGIKDDLKSQNREKNYILAEGMSIQPLVDLGVFHPDFTLIKKSSAKFKQINRFVEFADDLLKDLTPPADRPFTVVDFGCGKSYLTFILYWYFTEGLKWNVRMIGMDLKKDVIDLCNATAQKYNYSNLSFKCGDIGSFDENTPIDMIVTLHACDTATDHALRHAIARKVRFILSVPCCQHEINSQFESRNFKVFSSYGLIQERFSTLITDTVRAELLKYCNYQVQIMEFVDLSHTPKNMLIRAKLKENTNSDNSGHLQNVRELMNEFSLSPTLYSLLKKDQKF